MNVPRRDLLLAVTLAAGLTGGAVLAERWTPRRLLADTPGRRTLAQLVPQRFGAWREAPDVRLVPPTPDVEQALARVYDDMLARAYRAPDGQLVMLSLSYGRQQRGDTILHRPEVCYAGQGFHVARWPQDDGVLAASGRRIAATRLLTTGPRPEPVTYWLVVGDQVVRFGADWRWITLQQGLRGDIADGLLVRLSSVDARAERAFALHGRFVHDLAAALAPGDAPRLLGQA